MSAETSHAVELAATAERLLALAHDARRSERSVEARALVESAIVCATAADARGTLTHATRAAALFAYAAGDLDAAERDFRRASEAAHAASDPIAAARIDASLAFLAYDRGDAARAYGALDAIDARLATLGPDDAVDDVAALVVGYRGNLARQSDAIDDARRLYERAIERAPATSGGLRATFAMDLAAAELLAARPVEALRSLARADGERTAFPAGSNATMLLPPLVAHYRAIARLATGRPAEMDTGGPMALGPIRAWLWDATRGGTRAPTIDAALERRLARMGDDARELEHARISLRIVRTLSRMRLDDAVLVSRDGSAIVRDGRIVDLSRRVSLQRALERIARAHAHGAVVTLDEIVRAAWPGERIQPAAARNRVHVALATLRTLGLGDALERVHGGYRLAPRARVT